MALSSVYSMLHPHNWRKLAPDKRHPQSDPAAQEDWKKLAETLAEIRQGWAKVEPIQLMFQSKKLLDRHPDEARFGRINDKIVMVLDGAGWHASGALNPPPNMKLLPLPPYAPELNPVEHVWDELREKYFHNRVFDSLDALEDQLEVALRNFEGNAQMVKSIVAWKWIINALLN